MIRFERDATERPAGPCDWYRLDERAGRHGKLRRKTELSITRHYSGTILILLSVSVGLNKAIAVSYAPLHLSSREELCQVRIAGRKWFSEYLELLLFFG